MDDVNFLTLNPSKTEFLLIGLPQQLTKLTQTHLTLSDNTRFLQLPSHANLELHSTLIYHMNNILGICQGPVSIIFMTFDEFGRLWTLTLLAP